MLLLLALLAADGGAPLPPAADAGTPLPPPAPIGSRAELDALLASVRGQVVVVHLWATWCEPCLAELPRIIAAESTLRPRGVRLLSLAADPPENAAGVSAFARRLGAGFETRILTADPAEIARSLGLAGYRGSLPVTLVLDRQGVRRFEAVRSTRPGELEAAVAPLLPPL